LQPGEVSLQQQTGYDLLAELRFQYPTGINSLPPLHQLALPLWSQSGSAQIEGVDDARGGHLALTWEDGRTRTILRVPHTQSGSIELEVRDRSTSAELPRRATQVAARDRADRRNRFESGKVLARLPRELEKIKLGWSRDQVLSALPRGPKVIKHDLSDGFVLTNAADPPRNATCFARELVVRFGPNKRLAEMSVRYIDVPGKGGLNTLQNILKKRGGAPETASAPWVTLWSDLPAPKPAPVLSRWQDDATQVTCQRGPAGMEVVLRDCPVDQETGVSLAPLAYLPRGLGDCRLGRSKSELLKIWNLKDAPLVDGGLLLPPQAPGTYDALLVWFDKDKAVRIIARHVAGAAQPSEKLKQAVVQAWAQGARAFGWPWRQDATPEGIVQNWGTLDDATRVRIFWEENNEGTPRLYTEWKQLERP
jgi:hypothetical protein